MLVKKQLLKIRRVSKTGQNAIRGHISAMHAKRIGIELGFNVELATYDSSNPNHYRLSDGPKTDSEYAVESKTNLSHLDQKLIDAIGIAVGDIYDYAVNYNPDDCDEEEAAQFENSNLMYIDLKTHQVYDANYIEAVGWACA
ncbi:hypothetical protein ACFMJC_01760 [Acinetobacter baumannii]|uniref:hypothetical protein n=1 Tax=Acinetobacter baumannii TaxID=470 RepID=UPI00233FB93F|nr:hypothetical protein [Acinetobacter baumannii]